MIQFIKILNAKRLTLNANEGFTVLELLIGMSIFTVVVSIATSIFIQSTRGQRELVALMAANSSASLTMEQINREVRTGRDFCIDPATKSAIDCQLNGSIYKKLAFTNARGERVEYQLDPASSQITKILNGGLPVQITAGNVSVKNLSFYLQGQAADDNQNPRITIVMKVGAKNLPNLERFTINLESTINSRVLQTQTP